MNGVTIEADITTHIHLKHIDLSLSRVAFYFNCRCYFCYGGIRVICLIFTQY